MEWPQTSSPQRHLKVQPWKYTLYTHTNISSYVFFIYFCGLSLNFHAGTPPSQKKNSWLGCYWRSNWIIATYSHTVILVGHLLICQYLFFNVCEEDEYSSHIYFLSAFTLHLAKCKLTSLCIQLEAGGLTLFLAPNGDMFPCVTKGNRL